MGPDPSYAGSDQGPAVELVPRGRAAFADTAKGTSVSIGIHRLTHTFPVGDKVIYVREDDAELWEWAVAYARSKRMPVSGLVMNALEAYREQVEGEGA
jgi:hypothetical protein